MARFHAWAVLAMGVGGIGVGFGHAAGKDATASKNANAPVVTLKLAAAEAEEELVTPPLVIGSGCGHCAAPACRRPLWEWLTYTSSRPGLCNCHLDWAPCHAPYYSYFPCNSGCSEKPPRCAVGANLLTLLQDMACWRPEFPRIQAIRMSVSVEHVAASVCQEAPAAKP